ncbi:SDR family oxidoreductase [Mesorhizobium sp. B2-4-13]
MKKWTDHFDLAISYLAIAGGNMEGLAGRVALITGAGRGIGKLAAMRLAGGGARVALVSRSMDQLNDTLEHIEARGGSGIAIPGDVASAESVASIKSEVEGRLGPPSILINAAGIFGPIQLVWKTDPAAWINTVMINTVGPYLTSRAFVEAMVRQRWGRIVNITSAAALHEPGPINSAYGTSKAALNQFTRHLAAELEGTGVTANVIHPGDVKTEMWADIRDGVSDLGPVAERYREWAAWVERTGGDDPEKASELIERLMGENAAHINGRFLWIKNGLQLPIPSWGEFKPAEAWES